MIKKSHIKVCPRCGSTYIKSDMLTDGHTPLPQALVRFICIDCNFEGYLFPEVERNQLKKFQKEIKASKKKK